MPEKNNNLGISVAIVIAAIIIGGAVVYTNKNNPAPTDQATQPLTAEAIADKIKKSQPVDPKNISPVTAADHIRGDINAPIKIVEYSDMECPYCIRLHATLHQLVKEYPQQVAWVYRHAPLHRQAPTESVATECVAELGGEEKFWIYLDKIYDNSPGNDGFDLALLPKYAVEVGVDETAFTKCLTEKRPLAKINAQKDEWSASGARGTPHSIVITPKGEYLPVTGAQQIEVWRNVVEYLITQK